VAHPGCGHVDPQPSGPRAGTSTSSTTSRPGCGRLLPSPLDRLGLQELFHTVGS
jgi:hypothetical protein